MTKIDTSAMALSATLKGLDLAAERDALAARLAEVEAELAGAKLSHGVTLCAKQVEIARAEAAEATLKEAVDVVRAMLGAKGQRGMHVAIVDALVSAFLAKHGGA